MTHPLDRTCPKCNAIVGQPCVGSRGHVRKTFHQPRGTRRNNASLHVSTRAECDSPIEEIMVAVLEEWIDHSGYDIIVQTQVRFGPYRADIWIEDGDRKLVVECDGRAFHINDDQVLHDKRRDRFCAVEGIAVMRFAGSEIKNDPRGCAAQVGAWIRRPR